MIQLHRARLGLVTAVAGALALVGVEFPLSELLHQHSELALARGQLATITDRNASLSADVVALSANSTVNALAHEEYGLIRPGQRSFVILPAPNSAAAKAGLAAPVISPQDLVASAPVPGHAVIPTTARSASSFWSRFVSRLEFWHWGR